MTSKFSDQDFFGTACVGFKNASVLNILDAANIKAEQFQTLDTIFHPQTLQRSSNSQSVITFAFVTFIIWSGKSSQLQSYKIQTVINQNINILSSALSFTFKAEESHSSRWRRRLAAFKVFGPPWSATPKSITSLLRQHTAPTTGAPHQALRHRLLHHQRRLRVPQWHWTQSSDTPKNTTKALSTRLRPCTGTRGDINRETEST